MNRDQSIGVAILVISATSIPLYGWMIFTLPVVVLQFTVFIAVAAVLLLLVWIGWTMATVPPPVQFEPERVSSQSGASGDTQVESSHASALERSKANRPL